MLLFQGVGGDNLKKFILFPILWLIFPVFFIAEDAIPVKIESMIKPSRLYRAQEGKVILKIDIKKGMAISSQPTFVIEFSPCDALVFPKNFFTASDLGIEILENKGLEYLNLQKPIEIPFTVNTDAQRGKHSLEGKIKFFARSLDENWCLKTFSKFSASFYTRQTLFKKK